MTTLKAAVEQATRHLLRSDKAQTYRGKTDVWGNVSKYVIDIERTEDDRNELRVTTWGMEHEYIRIPQTRPELITMKMRAQMNRGGINDVIVRYTLDILHRESN